MFFTFFKLYKWYQIALSVSYVFTFCGSCWLWYSNKNNFIFRQEILLAAISEKDNQIGHLELQNSKNRRTEIKQLMSDKEQYVKDLKDQVYIKDFLQISLLILSEFKPVIFYSPEIIRNNTIRQKVRLFQGKLKVINSLQSLETIT